MALLSGLASGAGPAFGAYNTYLRYLLERKMREQEMAQQDTRAQAAEQRQFDFWKQQEAFRQQQREAMAQAERLRLEADPENRLRRARLATQLTGQPMTISGDILPQIDPNYQPPMPAPGQGVGPSSQAGRVPGDVSGILPPDVTIGQPQGTRLRDYVDPTAIRPGINLDQPWDGSKPVPQQYFLPQVSPAELRQRTEAAHNKTRGEYEATLRQLRTKMDGAVVANDMERAKRIAALIDKANADFPGLGVSGVDEFRQAQDRLRKTKLTEAGMTLRQARTSGLVKRGGGDTAKADVRQDALLQRQFEDAELKWRQANAEYVAAKQAGDEATANRAARKQETTGLAYRVAQDRLTRFRQGRKGQPMQQIPTQAPKPSLDQFYSR